MASGASPTPQRVPIDSIHGPLPLRLLSATTIPRSSAALAKGADNWSRQTIGQRIDVSVAPPPLVQWWINQMGMTVPANAVKLHEYVGTLEFSPHLREIKAPTLVLAGEKSPIATPQQIETTRSQIPDCKVVVFPGVGHGVHALMPERCVEEVVAFLREHSLS